MQPSTVFQKAATWPIFSAKSLSSWEQMRRDRKLPAEKAWMPPRRRLIVCWAILHDQYLVRIAPEHFTEYHEPLWGIENPRLLATALAFGASIGPGLILGIVCAVAGRRGSAKKVSPRFILLGAVVVVCSVELVASGSGFWVFRTNRTFYPESWFPDETLPIRITQTIQITSYLASAVFSTFLVFAILRRRRMASSSREES